MKNKHLWWIGKMSRSKTNLVVCWWDAMAVQVCNTYTRTPQSHSLISSSSSSPQ
jgi:hypothetical protein